MSSRFLSTLLLGLAMVLSKGAFAATPSAPLTPEALAAEYKLASGDVINITVFGEPELTRDKLTLSDAGTFSYPFLGDVQGKGKTANEIQSQLITGLKNGYLKDPKVTVSVLQYRDFYISGEVTKPGAYPYQPGLTVRRAIALGGGLTERASEKKITIKHDQAPDKALTDINLDTPLLPGDSVSVPEGFF